MNQLFSTLWLFNIAMENDPSIDDFLIITSIYNRFSTAMLNNQMVIVERSQVLSLWNSWIIGETQNDDDFYPNVHRP